MKKIYSIIIATVFLFVGLQASFAQNIINGGFESGDFTGWTVDQNFPGYAWDTPSGITQSATITGADSYATPTEGTKMAMLVISGQVSVGCGTAHGPALVSSIVSGVQAGDVITFDWKAVLISDDYDVYAFIVDVATGNETQLLYQTGSVSPWTTTSLASPYNGDIRFKFVCGTHDLSCGQAVGANMYIDNIKILRPTATDATLYTTTGFNANWLAYSGATTYYLDIATDPAFANIDPNYNNKNVGNVITYAATGLAPGTIYYYRVRGSNGTTTSGNSNVIKTAPAPVATAATGYGAGSFSANWDLLPLAIGYKIDVATDAAFTNILPSYNDLSVGNVGTYAITGVATNGNFYYRVRANYNFSYSSYSNTINAAFAPVGLAYTPATVVAGINATNVSSLPSTTGGSPITLYTISPALPTGVTIDANTGIISGTPSVISALTVYTVTGSNAGGSTTGSFTLTVSSIMPPTGLSYSPATVVATYGETNVSSTPTATGGSPITGYTIAPALPTGVTIDPTTGVISGIPTAFSALTVYTVTGSNAAGSTTASFTLTVDYTTTPVTQASNVVITNINYTSFDVAWTAGDGTKSAVFVFEGNSGDAVPVNLNTYDALPAYTAGDEIGTSGWYCVFNGIGTTVSVTGLTQNTEYRTMVVAYNGATGGEQYLTTVASNNPVNATTQAEPVVTVDGENFYGTLNSTIAIANLSTVTDPNQVENLIGVTVSISNNFVASEDVLQINGLTTGNSNGIDYDYNATTGVLSLTGSFSQTIYETVIRLITYNNTSTTPNKTSRTIHFAITGFASTDDVLVNFDTESPIAITQPVTINLGANGTITVTAEQVNNGSSDNTGIASMTVEPSAFDCSDLGENTVTFTVTDLLGNVTTTTAIVTVVDNTNPVAIGQNITITLDAAGTATATTTAVNNNSTDNCSIATMTLSKYTFNGTNIGPNNVTFTVTDPSGNSNSTTVVVTVTDEIDPVVVIVPGTPIILDGNGTIINLNPEDFDGGTTDNCDFTLTISPTSLSCDNIGENTITLTATDCAGNQTSATTTITVTDNIRPIIVCPIDQIIVAPSGSYTVVGNEFNLVSQTDNCSIESVINDLNNTATLAGQVFNVGYHTVTWLATDPSLNTRTCSFDVQVTLTSVINTLASNGIKIYPNPSANIFNVTGQGIQNIKVFDIAGKLVQEITTASEVSQINLTNYGSGIYFVKLQLENSTLNSKLVKK